MPTPTEMSRVTVRQNVAVEFSAITITGDLIYYPEQNALQLIDQETGCPERLSVNLIAEGLTPAPGNVFIKDWSECSGVAKSLETAGIVEIVAPYIVGNFASTAFEVRVLV